MEIIFVITFGILFLICLFLGIHERLPPLIVFAVILAVLIGSAMISTGIQLQTGTNSTLSGDNRTVMHTSINTDLPSIWTNALSLIFFILALWLTVIIVQKGEED